MKPGAVSTSALLTHPDAQTMTPDLHAQVGWSPPRPVGTGLGSALWRYAARWPAAAQEPAGPRSPARASSMHAIPAVAGAVYRAKGQAYATVAPRLVTAHRR